MIIRGTPVDAELTKIRKSIADNLKNKDKFNSVNTDTATNAVELNPPVPMSTCLYVFKNSSHVAKCSRILAADVVYNNITLTYDDLNEHSDAEINQLKTINDFVTGNIDELYYLLVDYNYAGWCAMEYIWDNTRFNLQQIPIHSCSVLKVKLPEMEVYLLQQKINSTTKYFKIMGETYPNNFNTYNNQPLGNASLIGGDNIYQFFSLPRWIQDYDEILTDIAISKADYQTVSNGNISSGILNINLEPQLPQPIQYDDDNQPIYTKSREEVITDELQSSNGGTAVIFTESNRPVKLDYVGLSNKNQDYLSNLKTNCQDTVLNDYNIPKIRLMINTDKESMNSDKSKSIWEIYTINLKNEQKPLKLFIKELIKDLYGIGVDVEVSTPIFTDKRETEVKLLIDIWNAGAITLKQFITGLSNFLDYIDLNDYDFTINREVWDYRKLPELNDTLSPDDLALIEQVEAQLNEVKS